MVIEDGATPEEGELVVATIKTVKQNGAYVDLDEYVGTEGFIFIGEIASGWVKNIRGFVREGQRVICKVMRTRRDGTSLELSLKSVSEERRRDRLQEWKNEQRAQQLLKVLGEKIGWSEDQVAEQASELTDAFGSLYTAFEEAAMQEGALENAGFEGDWLTSFIEIAVENNIPPFVEVRGTLTLSINVNDGVSVIRSALEAAESLSNEEQEIDIKCFYDGAPSYRIELKAPDFKVAETMWEQATQAVVEHMSAAGGEAHAERE
ncbi:MAG: translation initiation factor IF-2 subunit alpha [Candidatus Thermoplasmatota archaeon]|nr:translation initiation factor IF-2 subunit alpha [Candidatus Thermoplasmatota archaeon]